MTYRYWFLWQRIIIYLWYTVKYSIVEWPKCLTREGSELCSVSGQLPVYLGWASALGQVLHTRVTLHPCRVQMVNQTRIKGSPDVPTTWLWKYRPETVFSNTFTSWFPHSSFSVSIGNLPTYIGLILTCTSLQSMPQPASKLSSVLFCNRR